MGIMLLTRAHMGIRSCVHMLDSFRKDFEAKLSHWNLMIGRSLQKSTMLKLIYIN